MTAAYPGHGLSNPAYSYNIVNYDKLLTDPFEGISIWSDLISTFNTIYDNNVHYSTDQFYSLRTAQADVKFINQNISMMGYKVNIETSLNVNTQLKIFRNLGTFIKTRGTSTAFLHFVGFVQSTQFTFIPLWANSLSNTIAELSDTYGTTVWNGGTWFPTPYFDIGYNESDYPNLDIPTITQLLKPITPIYLVLRSFVTSFTTSATYYESTVTLESSELTTSN